MCVGAYGCAVHNEGGGRGEIKNRNCFITASLRTFTLSFCFAALLYSRGVYPIAWIKCAFLSSKVNDLALLVLTHF